MTATRSVFAAVRAFVLRAVLMILASIALVIVAVVVFIEMGLVVALVVVPMALALALTRAARWVRRRGRELLDAARCVPVQKGELR